MYIYETADEIEYELLKANAIKNRQYATQAENLLWLYLKGKQSGYKFRRQHVIKQYIADFINLKYKLIVEIDGKYHFRDEQIIKDEERLVTLSNGVIGSSDSLMKKSLTIEKKLSRRLKRP